jgi:hypothetical protein
MMPTDNKGSASGQGPDPGLSPVRCSSRPVECADDGRHGDPDTIEAHASALGVSIGIIRH